MAKRAIRPKEPQAVDRHVAERLRQRRLELGKSQDAIGEALGVTFQQVQKYEKGTNRLRAGRLYNLAKLLDVEVSYFFEGLSTVAPRRRRAGRKA